MPAESEEAGPTPTLAEREMWEHVSWATAVNMYAKRNGMDFYEDRELIKGVFRAASGAATTDRSSDNE